MPEIGTQHGRPSGIDLEEHASRLALLQRARAGDRTAMQALADRYHVRIGGVAPRVEQPETPRNTVQQEATMGSEMATCDVCGQQVKRQGLGVHKARKHGVKASPMTNTACQWCGEAKANLWEHKKVCPKRPGADGNGKTKALASELLGARLQPSAAKSPSNGHCASCLFRGLERHIEQDLVRRAVVAGMALDAACTFVRDVKAVLAQ